MRDVKPGQSGSVTIEATSSHTAAASGNTGVEAVATTSLILFLEDASDRAIRDCFEQGETSVGTAVDVRHEAAAPVGALIDAAATVVAVNGRRVTLAVEARHGERVLMRGTHERLVVDLDRFLREQGLVQRT